MVEFMAVKDIGNTFVAFKELMTSLKLEYEGFMILHGDTVVGVPL